MSKNLLMIRHGKSSWDAPGLSDHERPLLKLGIERTKRMAHFLSEKRVVPDLIISSHAVRAFETAKLLAKELGYPKSEIQIERNIYYHDAEGLYSLVMALPDDKDVVMLVGHNPTMTQFANFFLEEKIDYMPTTGIVSVSFDTEHWNELPMSPGRVNFLAAPKMLKA
jgi:phosphohistidine phosphatase